MSEPDWRGDHASGESGERPISTLDAYLDGMLDATARESFERRLSIEPELRAQLELQREIDASLGRLFAYEVSAPTPRPIPFPAPGLRFSSRLGWLIGLAAAVVLVASFLHFYQPDGLRHRPAAAVYAEFAANGWKPAWRCESDQEFADMVNFYLGAAVVVPMNAPGVELLGWSYADKPKEGTPLGQQALALLTHVEGERVLVLMDRLTADRRLRVPDDSGLHLFRRELNGVVMYEVTPLEEPRVLPAAVKATASPRPERGSGTPE